MRHDRGRIVEENHYYAYGLRIDALSSKAFNGPANNYLYQGDFAELDEDLGWTDYLLRSYDAQIGRWLQNDPYDEFNSGYLSMGGDPSSFIDSDGGCVYCETVDRAMTLKEVVVTLKVVKNSSYFSKAVEFSAGFFEGIAAGASTTYNFIAVDAWKSETWINTGYLVGGLAISSNSVGGPSNGRALMSMIDSRLGTRLGDTYDATAQSFNDFVDNIPNMSARDFGKMAGQGTFAALTTKGLTATTNTIATLSKTARIAKVAKKAGSPIAGEAAKTGTTVLGHYPQYVKVAETIGARTFQIPTKIWNKMTPAQQWGANQKFLDRMILRGDNIRLATPLNQVKPGSFYQKELNYLFDKGYKVSSDGLWLVK
ncbi:MAG TPA: RHS repeat-associated core domain-containing protein [Flavihumibacter sp.]